MSRLLLIGLGVLVFAGCQKPVLSPENYETVAKDPRRDTEAARKQTADAVRHVDAGRLDEAEKMLKAALVSDLFYGPAHNNLGLVYYDQKRLYLAATEFQYAVKLMPGATQPHNNLGMVFEAIGRLEEAAKNYDEALALEPENAEVTANLARVRVRLNQKDDKTRRLLEDVVMKSDRPDWVQWAKDRLATMGRPEPSAGEVFSVAKPSSGSVPPPPPAGIPSDGHTPAERP